MSEPHWSIRWEHRRGRFGRPDLYHVEIDTAPSKFYGIESGGVDVWGCGITAEQAIENLLGVARMAGLPVDRLRAITQAEPTP